MGLTRDYSTDIYSAEYVIIYILIFDFTLPACPTGCNQCEAVGGKIVCKEEECFENYEEIDTSSCVGQFQIISLSHKN